MRKYLGHGIVISSQKSAKSWCTTLKSLARIQGRKEGSGDGGMNFKWMCWSCATSSQTGEPGAE
jgi:hypothetical protein